MWAVEGSNGAGRPLAQRLLEAGEPVVDVLAKLSARVRLFDTGHNRKTDARDAHSIAAVAVRTKTLRVLRRISDAIYRQLIADDLAVEGADPGGHRGSSLDSSAVDSHPPHRHFGSATPGPATPTLRPTTSTRKRQLRPPA